ncbi:hypothetical protein K438DRAFT_1797862 [Mycena galopus ATCC 62051]|nr:hypothetical protein K438DRAFT_1797862 [Mycena galopus ATCC 62051]
MHDDDPVSTPRRAYNALRDDFAPPELTFDPASPVSAWSPWTDDAPLSPSIDIGGFEFDDSCFEELDEQLLYHPVQSFADVCWAAAVHNRRASTVSVVSVSNANSHSREVHAREKDSETVPARTRTRTTSRLEPRPTGGVRWAEDDVEAERVLRSRSATDLRESHRDREGVRDNGLLAPPPPFSDRLNVVTPPKPQQRLVAEPFPFPLHVSAKSPPPYVPGGPAPPPPTPTTPATCLNPRTSKFVLNLNLGQGYGVGHADPSESIGFFPSRPPSSRAPKAKSKPSPLKAFSPSTAASVSASSSSTRSSPKMPRFFAYFHARR